MSMPGTVDIKSLQNRLLKVCYVPATSAGLPRLLFDAAINSANEANKAGICAVNQSILHRCLCLVPWISKVFQLDCLRFVMCPLIAPVFQGFFLAAAINSTNEANKADGTYH